MTARPLRQILFYLLALITLSARGEFVLTNYVGTNLIKIMPVGDSITDDCVTNGAWRAPLQQWLDSGGLPFTNVGRLTSAAAAGFTKRKHEGYCGSVVAPPGYVAVYNYSATDAYLLRIVRDALIATNITPDLLLVLIGVNDIGHGRNPWTVATNDMPNLLKVIFFGATNAHVFFSKITSLQSASLGYSPYATNVLIYNAALQAMVNQRRALGQKVFLADMFSAVDYNTMFQSDHVHPNTLGLQAIANEWAARLETIVVHSNKITSVLVNGGADWKYSDSGQDLGTNWAQPGFDDSAWSHGLARLGYGDPATATTVSFGPDSTNKFTTTYFRHPFVVPRNAVITNLNFRLARAHGAAVWLNGQELFRVNLPDGDLTYTNLALSAMTGFTAHVFYPTNIPVPGLPTGTNLLAVELHQSSTTNSTLGFDMELIGSGYPAPSLSIAPASNNNVVVSWPAINSAGFSLFSTTNLATGTWSQTAFPAFTNGNQIVVTQSLDGYTRFFRLQR